MSKFQYTNREPNVRERIFIPFARNPHDVNYQVQLLVLRRLDDDSAQWSDYWKMGHDDFQRELDAMWRGITEWASTQQLLDMMGNNHAFTTFLVSNESTKEDATNVQDGSV